MPYIHIPTTAFLASRRPAPQQRPPLPTPRRPNPPPPPQPNRTTARLANSSFSYPVRQVEKDLANMSTWANELLSLRRRCDELYEQAKKAQMAGEYDRAQRRLETMKRVARAVDREWLQRGLGGSARAARGVLG